MLFDLRGRGRRRTVQAIYLTLAVLMGGGLVFFGIGGEVSGGLFDALGLTDSGGGSQTSSSKLLESQEKAVQQRLRANPRDATALATLTRIRYQQAGQGDNYDQQTGQFTEGGRRELAQAVAAWERYLALKPPRPNSDVAALMVQAYSPLGVNQPAKGVAAAEIVAEARPSAQTYYQLALFAYAAKQTRKADLAAAKALELAPPDQRAQVKSQLDAAKQQGGFGQSATGGGSNAPPSG
jgi:tetratricopeptide (TPR) repeat protein